MSSMRSKCRAALVALVAVLSVSAVASASASAFNFEWEANGVKLGAGVTKKVVSSGGAFTIVWAGKLITCTSEAGTGTITGGKPGTGEVTKLTFTGCQPHQAGCSVKTVGQPNGTIVVANLPTVLVQREKTSGHNVLADEFKQNKTTKEWVTLKFEGTCSEYPELKIKGQIASEVINLTSGSIELNFPTAGLGRNELEGLGFKMAMTGKVTGALEGGETLSAS